MARKLTSREQKIMAVCILMVLVYGGYRAIYIPLSEYYSTLDSSIQKNEKKLRKSLEIIERGKSYQKLYDELLEQYQQTDSDERTMSSILSEIEEVANENEMNVSQLKPQRVRREDFYNYFSVSLSIDGSLDKIMLFLHILQNEPYAFDVAEVKVYKTSPRIKKLKCQLVIKKAFLKV